jgi:orotidine-5'-phosphate decarboxylase
MVDSKLFTYSGPLILKEIADLGKKVFLDLNFHASPEAAAGGVAAAARHGVFMLTIQTIGGMDMMRACSESVVNLALKENIQRPKIFGVTLLPETDYSKLRDEIGFPMSHSFHIKTLARLAMRSGLDGVVSCPEHIQLIRESCGDKFQIIAKGITPYWHKEAKENVWLTPKKALRMGADYIVMAFSELDYLNPINDLKTIYEELAFA